MDKREIASLAVIKLKENYPEAFCSLNYKNPLELLIATRLSAQCTDARVNLVTPELFKRFNSLESFAQADPKEVEIYIHSCGFYKTKAQDIVNMCKILKENYNKILPDNLEELIKLPGVGRKTANLILGVIFKKPAIIVDTHCIRLTRRLGLHEEKDAFKIEKILKELIPPEESCTFCHRLVLHGRLVCRALKTNCKKCCMEEFCKKA